MAAVPVVVKAVLAVGLLLAMARAFRGAPPARPRPGAARLALGVGVTCGALAAVGAYTEASWAAGPAAAAVLAASLAGWCSRSPSGSSGPGGAGGPPSDDPPSPEPPSPVDWDAFDRERAAWARRRVRVP
jgi:hypothetical protein